MTDQTILIPLDFPDPEPLPSSFVDSFTTCKVTLLGLYETPADMDPDTEQRERVKAYNTLYSYADQFVRSGDVAEVELVMGTDLDDVPTEVAEQRDVDAMLVPNPITTLGNLLVPIRDEKFADPISAFVGSLDKDAILHTTLLHVVDDESATAGGDELLKDVRQKLVDAGFPSVRIDTEVVVSDDPAFAISNAAAEYDLIIMGETEESDYDRVFGPVYESVAEQTEHPVVIIRE